MANKKFPVLWTIILIIAIVWFLDSMNWIPETDIAWIPLILIIVALGAIINRLIFGR